MSLPQKRLIPGILLMLMLSALATPLWWTDDVNDTRVIPIGAVENHKGPANIGQAKHMADMALKALASKDPNLSATIRQKLTTPQPNPTDSTGPLLPAIINFELPSTLPADWSQSQRAPLLIGQLKAIVAPFYTQLHAAAPEWLAAERTANGTNHPESIFPWTTETTDDDNKAIATTGQLKAVFSLRFDALTKQDSDNDGMDDVWELEYDLNPADASDSVIDSDGDGVSNIDEYTQGSNPRVSNTSNRKIWNFRKVTNTDRTITYTWNSYAKNGDWFHIERLQPDKSWKIVFSTTYGSDDLPFAENATSYAITLNPLTDFLQ